jgi:hypothetical protein
MDKQKQKGISFSLGIVIVLLVAIVVGGIIVWQMWPERKAPSPSPTPPIDETAEWRTPSFNRDEIYILLKEVESPNKEIRTAFSLYEKNYICLNTQRNPIIKNEQQLSSFSSSKEIYCGNYYILEQYYDDTGPLLYGPFYDGNLDIDTCSQDTLSNACYFVAGTRSNNVDVCRNITDFLWQEKCLMSIALNTENIKMCSNLSKELERECYENFNKFFKKTDELCREFADFDDYLGSSCYRTLSVVQKDILVCDKIKDDWVRDKCIMEPIIWEHMRDHYTNLDKIDCNKIKNEQDKNRCFLFMKEYFSK